LQRIAETSRPPPFILSAEVWLNGWWRPIVPQSRRYVDLVGGIEGRCDLNIDIDGLGIAARVIRQSFADLLKRLRKRTGTLRRRR
jgi:hypothetical protein